MKTTTIAQKNIAFIGMLFAMIIVFSFGFGSLKAHAAITSTMDVGSTGGEVSQLQQFLASNSLIYPQGIVSGYFGNLTRLAVIQFQVANDIAQVGTVGPITKARINAIMNSGLGLDTSAPFISSLSASIGTNGATVLWTNSEPAQGQVYYDTQPILSNEATAHFQLPYVSGTLVANTTFQMSHAITLANLQLNTTYYYIVRSIDRSGNVTMTPLNSFRTGN